MGMWLVPSTQPVYNLYAHTSLTTFATSLSLLPAITMPESNNTTSPDYTKTFDPASAIDNYKKLMGIKGQDSPGGTLRVFASKLDDFKSTSAVSNELRNQMRSFDEFSPGNELLMTWLESIVDLLFMLSNKLEGSPQAVSVEKFILPVLRYYNTSVLAVLPRENNLCCYRSSS